MESVIERNVMPDYVAVEHPADQQEPSVIMKDVCGRPFSSNFAWRMDIN